MNLGTQGKMICGRPDVLSKSNPTLVIAAIWGQNQQVKDISLSLSAFASLCNSAFQINAILSKKQRLSHCGARLTD